MTGVSAATWLPVGDDFLDGGTEADSLFGEIFVISEVILGYFTLGLLLAILANTIARRS